MPISTTLVSLRSRRQPARIVGGRRRPFAKPVARHHDLADDLAGGQIAHQPLRAGVAEAAGERAADLARNAERAAILLGDVDGLDFLAVARSAAAICACRRPRPARSRSRAAPSVKALGELAAKLLGDVGHGGEVGGAAVIEPAPELAAPACASAARARRARASARRVRRG